MWCVCVCGGGGGGGGEGGMCVCVCVCVQMVYNHCNSPARFNVMAVFRTSASLTPPSCPQVLAVDSPM